MEDQGSSPGAGWSTWFLNRKSHSLARDDCTGSGFRQLRFKVELGSEQIVKAREGIRKLKSAQFISKRIKFFFHH